MRIVGIYHRAPLKENEVRRTEQRLDDVARSQLEPIITLYYIVTSDSLLPVQ